MTPADASILDEALRLRPRLLYAVGRRLRDEAAAEDVVQQTLFKAWRKLHRYDPTRPLAPWLMTLALRLAEDYARRNQRHRTHQALPDHLPALATADPLCQRETEEALWSIARRVLPPRESTALWLQYGEDLTPAQIATALRLTTGHVRVLLHRARRALEPHVAHLLTPERVPA